MHVHIYIMYLSSYNSHWVVFLAAMFFDQQLEEVVLNQILMLFASVVLVKSLKREEQHNQTFVDTHTHTHTHSTYNYPFNGWKQC